MPLAQAIREVARAQKVIEDYLNQKIEVLQCQIDLVEEHLVLHLLIIDPSCDCYEFRTIPFSDSLKLEEIWNNLKSSLELPPTHGE